MKVKVLADGTKLTKEHWAAQHKWFDMIAHELNDAGLTLKPFMEQVDYKMDIPWTGTMIKQILYKPILETQTGKETTKEMTPFQAKNVNMALEWWLSTHTGVQVDFPSEESNG